MRVFSPNEAYRPCETEVTPSPDAEGIIAHFNVDELALNCLSGIRRGTRIRREQAFGKVQERLR